MLFSHGIAVDQDLAVYFGIERRRYKSHHALDDARFLRAIYVRALEGKR